MARERSGTVAEVKLVCMHISRDMTERVENLERMLHAYAYKSRRILGRLP